MHKLGINLESIDGLSPKEYLKTIKELGFDATFTDMTYTTDLCHIAELCALYDLEYSFVHAPFAGTNSLWRDGIEGEELFGSLLYCIDCCKEANIPTAVVHISAGFNPPPMSELGQNRFRKLVEHGLNKNVNIAFENLRVPEFLAWAMDTFKQNKNVGFCWDIGHENCFTEGIEYMSLYGDRLLCTHIHDNNCKRGGDLHLLPFDGKIDYEKSMPHIKKSGYKGSLMLEVFTENKYTGNVLYRNLTPHEFLEKAYQSIKKVASFIK